ncbi:MAG: heat-shock protein Hsp20 [Leptospiraceae bacterium]|nr:MAG: heat-shock protein Hsp20 [Leptospiraceae bacterium]
MKDWLPDLSKAWEKGESFRKDIEQYLVQMQRDMEKMFTDLRRGFDLQVEEASKFIQKFIPSINVTEDEDKITIKVELPGVEPKDVNLTIENDTLVIEGEKKEEKQSEQEKVKILESAYGHFKRVIALPETIDANKIEATYKNGVLTIVLPKKEEAKKPKQKIEIKTEN